MNRDLVRQITNVLAIIAAITVNILANALPLNGQNTGAISDRFRVLFVPAGYVFAIWGLIYIGWIAFGVYQVLPSQRENPRLRRIGYLFALSCVANMAWLFCWHYNQFALSVVVMLALLGLLIAIYLRLEIGIKPVSTAEKWTVNIPFSVYLGWITVATIANITDLLYYVSWSGWGLSPEVWTVIMLAAAVIITALMLLTRGDIAFALVIVWALLGITLKQLSNGTVAVASLAANAIVLGLLIFTLVRGGRGK
jgi:benzodiazapine receptor